MIPRKTEGPFSFPCFLGGVAPRCRDLHVVSISPLGPRHAEWPEPRDGDATLVSVLLSPHSVDARAARRQPPSISSPPRASAVAPVRSLCFPLLLYVKWPATVHIAHRALLRFLEIDSD
ncbi:hypothetical protein NL676_019000 [Syzygium grande]|nr:hypothetical protein NL676_019000 [Syzygium grande]